MQQVTEAQYTSSSNNETSDEIKTLKKKMQDMTHNTALFEKDIALHKQTRTNLTNQIGRMEYERKTL